MSYSENKLSQRLDVSRSWYVVYLGSGIAGLRASTYFAVRLQWLTAFHAAIGQISSLRAILERNFQVLILFLISEKRALTSTMVGRLEGSS
jgi:hypothetical protein